uniref:Uncharacterized protein n=1 Tax=viral metagenome TaxID=1070528 RepID=A0A6C0BNZ1_9ZZZZ
MQLLIDLILSSDNCINYGLCTLQLLDPEVYIIQELKSVLSEILALWISFNLVRSQIY